MTGIANDIWEEYFPVIMSLLYIHVGTICPSINRLHPNKLPCFCNYKEWCNDISTRVVDLPMERRGPSVQGRGLWGRFVGWRLKINARLHALRRGKGR